MPPQFQLKIVLSDGLIPVMLQIPPVMAAAALLILPWLSIAVFQKSERETGAWLGTGFDTDQELLRVVHSGHVSDTPVGVYLKTLRGRFPAEIGNEPPFGVGAEFGPAEGTQSGQQRGEENMKPRLKAQIRLEFSERDDPYRGWRKRHSNPPQKSWSRVYQAFDRLEKSILF